MTMIIWTRKKFIDILINKLFLVAKKLVKSKTGIVHFFIPSFVRVKVQ